MNKTTVIATRLARQGLVPRLESRKAYVDLFRALQPVSTTAATMPGSPPSVQPRTTFDDMVVTEQLRGRRDIVKGRFLGGGIGYVLAEDLGTYANAFRKPLAKMNETQTLVFEAIELSGGLTPRQIKEETGLLNKEIMPALHRLQTAFLVYEDQVTPEWERGWYPFASEWPDIEIDEEHRQAATVEVLARFLKAHVFATFEQIKDWSKLAARPLKQYLDSMGQAEQIQSAMIDGLGEGWTLTEDSDLTKAAAEPSVFMLHKADPMVRSHTSELKRRYGKLETLQHLLIDGEFQGTVTGHWRIGPHDVDDIVVDLPQAERAKRKKAILAVVAERYCPPHSNILRYDGKEC